MQFWIYFWAAVLVIGLTVFALLAVVVSIGGFFDALAMFRNITKQHKLDKSPLPRHDID